MRLIPILSRINGSLNGLLAGKESTSSLKSMNHSFATDKLIKFEDVSLLQSPQIATLKLSSIYKEVKGRKLLLPSELQLERGSILGVVGPSGVGKTTLLNILSGLDVPDACSLMINDIDYPLFILRNHVSLVTQTPIFFRGTIRDNLTTTSPKMVLDLKRAKNLITYLGLSEDAELFLETRLDNNSGLSGGELQRLALVRAFLSNREVLLLDEATSAQDDENEKRIMKLLNEDAGNRITVVVSHRASFIEICNTIIEIDMNRLSK
jgi:ABC-type bacteriocin/lantibiotic exporter with double-glycine peptidase domain